MNARKLSKIERRLQQKGTKRLSRKEKLLRNIEDEFKEWLKLTEQKWWQKRSP